MSKHLPANIPTKEDSEAMVIRYAEVGKGLDNATGDDQRQYSPGW